MNSFSEFQDKFPYITAAVKAVFVFAVVLQLVPLLIWLERKLCAWIQDRVGPNRVGPFGLLQPLADAIKLALKEDLTPRGVDRAIYTIAPFIVYFPAMLTLAVLPIAAGFQIASLNIGVVYLMTVGSLGVYGIAFGGWASNNKYSLLGGIRSSAQMISYEIALGMSIVVVVMMSGTVDLAEIVLVQQGGLFNWHVFQQPVLALIFVTSAFAETNRLPFDLAECEAELVGGFHTEYTSLKFAMFFLGEYVAMITMSSLFIVMFLGGWHVPFMDPLAAGESVSWLYLLASMAVFGVKLAALLFFFVWVRWTLPRFRYDQLMYLGWKCFIPLNLVLIAMTASMMVAGWKSYLPLGNLALLAILAVIAASRKPQHKPTNFTARGERTGSLPENLPPQWRTRGPAPEPVASRGNN